MKTADNCDNLKSSLDKLYNWSCAWQLSIPYKNVHLWPEGRGEEGKGKGEGERRDRGRVRRGRRMGIAHPLFSA